MYKKGFSTGTVPIRATQNFLVNDRLVRRLLDKTTISMQDHVLEIGSGKGIITKQLVTVAKHLTAYELDVELYQKLCKVFENISNITLKQMDFLLEPLPSFGDYKVFSSIPYSITAEILSKITKSDNPPVDAYLILQKQPAYKYVGIPEETMRSLLLKPLFSLKILHQLEREDFVPRPSVDSVLMHIARKDEPDLSKNDYNAYKDFIAYAFMNGWRKHLDLFTYEQTKRILKELKINRETHLGEVQYIHWLELFRRFQKYSNRQLEIKNAYQRLSIQQSKLEKRHRNSYKMS